MLPRLIVLSSCALGSFLIGCGGNRTSNVAAPEQLTLYSLDPHSQDKGVPKSEEPLFHHWIILGRVDVTESTKRAEIAKALKDSLAKKDVSQKKCFWPRHGIRTKEQGQERAYVICFQCSNVDLFEDDKFLRMDPIGDDAQELLNKVLTDAGVKIAP